MKKKPTKTVLPRETLIRPIGLPLSTDDYRLVIPGEVPAPTPRDIQKAIDVLIASKAVSTSIAEDGAPGDAFLVYDLALRIHGMPTERIQSQFPLHRLFTKEGLSTASIRIETALLEIVQPMKNYSMALINDAMEQHGIKSAHRLENKD